MKSKDNVGFTRLEMVTKYPSYPGRGVEEIRSSITHMSAELTISTVIEELIVPTLVAMGYDHERVMIELGLQEGD